MAPDDRTALTLAKVPNCGLVVYLNQISHTGNLVAFEVNHTKRHDQSLNATK